MIAINKLYEVAMQACCDYNDANPERFGMAFINETDGTWDAVIASNAYAIKVRNVEKPDGPFLSYLENGYTSYKYPMEIEKILETIDCDPKAAVIAETTNRNMQNHLDYIYCLEQEIRTRANMICPTGDKSRFIFRPYGRYLDKKNKEVECYLTPKEVPNSFERTIVGKIGPYELKIVSNPRIPVEELDFTHEYKCILVPTTDGILLNPVAKFGDIMMGYIDSPGLYLRDMSGTVTPEQNTSIMINKVYGELEKMEEVHVRVKLFRDVLNVFKALSPNAAMSLYFPSDKESPMAITCNDEEGEITAKLMGLDTSMDRQWG